MENSWVVGHTYNLSSWETEVGECKFEAALGYTMRPYLKQTNKQKPRKTL
jgi:hypothetical protein